MFQSKSECNRFSLRPLHFESASMKYIILITVAVSVAVCTADIAVAGKVTNNNKLATKVITKSPQLIEPLLKTLAKLVEGVLDGDKFVLDLLRLPAKFKLTTTQRMELKRIWQYLNKIKQKFLIK